MTTSLERIQIVGLHGNKTIDARLNENTLILVGENGSGKTTFLRILFHFLSGHWLSLSQFPFEYVASTIAGNEYKVTHNELVKVFRTPDRRFLADIPPPYRARVMELLDKGDFERIFIEIERITARYGVRPDRVLRELEILEEKPRWPKKELQEAIEKIKASMSAQILYLPTYRRIERELGSIFEGIDPDNLRRQRVRYRQRESDEAYIELVEFGMKDVQQAVDKALESLKEFAREGLNDLTIRYLGGRSKSGIPKRGYEGDRRRI